MQKVHSTALVLLQGIQAEYLSVISPVYPGLALHLHNEECVKANL